MVSGNWARLYGEHYRLIAGGIGVLTACLLLSLIFVGYDAQWLTTVQSKEDLRAHLTQLTSFITAISNETSIRAVVAPNVNAVTSARITTLAAYSAFKATIAIPSVLATLDALLNDYVILNTTSPAAVLTVHLRLVRGATNAMYASIRHDLTPRSKAIADHLITQQIAWRQTSLASQLGLAHRSKFSGSVADATEINTMAIAMIAANESMQLMPPGLSLNFMSGLVNLASATVAASFSVASPVIATTIKSATVNAAYSQSNSMQWYLASITGTVIPNMSSAVRVRVIVYGVGAGLAFTALVVCIVVVVRHIFQTRRARQLTIAFRDADASKKMFEVYHPILQYMRIQDIPVQPRTDVEKEYHVAAKLLMQLRPLMPQALFGDLNSKHKRQPNGAWDITSLNVRLEMGMAFCHCTVLTIAINSTTMNHGTKEVVGGVLTEASMAFNTIVEEVNNSGGLVIGFGAGGRISCVWNATNLVDDPSFIAVKTSRLIDKRLGALNIGRDLNIASGPCIVANTKVGGRKHVTFIGGAFDVAEKLLLLNEGHVSRLIIDYETYKELPRDQQRTCKPIAVITDKDEAPIVVMSADEDASLKGDQWKQYNTAFTLYQNNMLSESLAEFKKYLAVHPGDHCATWLIENVLEPKIGRRKSIIPGGR